MNYLKEYGITQEEIEYLKDRFNDNIIEFFIENEEFIKEKLNYLKDKGYIIYPIIQENIKIFLEILPALEMKINRMEEMKYSKKQIQMILMDENLYSNIK